MISPKKYYEKQYMLKTLCICSNFQISRKRIKNRCLLTALRRLRGSAFNIKMNRDTRKSLSTRGRRVTRCTCRASAAGVSSSFRGPPPVVIRGFRRYIMPGHGARVSGCSCPIASRVPRIVRRGGRKRSGKGARS